MTALFWFRRDLRLDDNHGLYRALTRFERVVPVFIYDSQILGKLDNRSDSRLKLIDEALDDLDQKLSGNGSSVLRLCGDPTVLIPMVARQLGAVAVITNADYEPYARERDQQIYNHLQKAGISFDRYKDHVIFHESDITKADGLPYVVFTPYSRAWKARLSPADYQHFPSLNLINRLHKPVETAGLPVATNSLSCGMEPATAVIQGTSEAANRMLDRFRTRLSGYGRDRDFPAKNGVSFLSPYLRFGQLSIRECVRLALSSKSEGAQKWLNELIWRDFYSQILWHFPKSATQSFNPAYRNLNFPSDETLFSAWCDGRTGFPLVDAAMRQLNQTGWMHNRLRMVTASFLVKDLLVDWRWGEAYFASKLLDFDLASNNGGWQWAASTGCDAQPWFRIFNPVTQSEKFDPEGTFIRKYVPELAAVPPKWIHQPWTLTPVDQHTFKCRIGSDYPEPVVDHSQQRTKALALFQSARQ